MGSADHLTTPNAADVIVVGDVVVRVVAVVQGHVLGGGRRLEAAAAGACSALLVELARAVTTAVHVPLAVLLVLDGLEGGGRIIHGITHHTAHGDGGRQGRRGEN